MMELKSFCILPITPPPTRIMPVAALTFFGLVASVATSAPTGMCRNHPGTGFNATNFLLNLQQLPDTSARCNDGSQAHMYFRPCCNGDSPGDFCNAHSADWLIVFGDGNEQRWCWDEQSCAQRAKLHPELVSSAGLPNHFSRGGDGAESDVGAFDKGGEANPNFYGAYAAYIPYCSSDLFLGECSHDSQEPLDTAPSFCGKSIARAAVAALVQEMHKYGADNVVLVGGAGIMTFVDELKGMMPQGAKVTAVCDGCILFDDLPSPGSHYHPR